MVINVIEVIEKVIGFAVIEKVIKVIRSLTVINVIEKVIKGHWAINEH